MTIKLWYCIVYPTFSFVLDIKGHITSQPDIMGISQRQNTKPLTIILSPCKLINKAVQIPQFTQIVYPKPQDPIIVDR